MTDSPPDRLRRHFGLTSTMRPTADTKYLFFRLVVLGCQYLNRFAEPPVGVPTFDDFSGISAGHSSIALGNRNGNHKAIAECSLRSRSASPPPNPAGMGGALRSFSVGILTANYYERSYVPNSSIHHWGTDQNLFHGDAGRVAGSPQSASSG